ncbi:MAG: lysophospholipid acyltransferase family protein [Alistipes sp.]|nr:lysophospholipid acyltransferase family protein [Alistipes sp.]
MSSYNDTKMSFGARLLWILCRAVAITPHWFQYGCLGNLIYFLLRYVARYRRSLIIHQLEGSFPDKSEEEIAKICNDYYHFRAQTFIGTATLAGMKSSQRLEALELTVPEHIKKVVEGRDFVYLSSHHNFWEYAQFSGLPFEGHKMLFAYHPLSSKVWDELYYHLRYSEDGLPVPSSQLIRFYLEHRQSGVDGKRMLMGLIADQNAAPKGDVHWYNFLNRPTLFFEGGEQLALKFHLPVLYLGMSYISPGRYKGEVTLLYDGDEKVEKHEITERYVRQLERDIEREPAHWMWSHRRWKYYPDPVTGEPIYRQK